MLQAHVQRIQEPLSVGIFILGRLRGMSSGYMHVALAIPHLRGGGAERTVARIARGLMERGHAVDVVVFRGETAVGNELPKQVRLIVLKPEPEGWFRNRRLIMRAFGVRAACLVSGTLVGQSRGFARYLDRERPDCVLPSLPKMKVAAFVAAQLAAEDPAIIPIVHSSLSRRGRKYLYLYSIMFPDAEKVVAVSEGVAADLNRKLELAPGLIERIYNPVVDNEMEALAEEEVDHPWLHDEGPADRAGCREAGARQGFPDVTSCICPGGENPSGTPDHAGGRSLAWAAGETDPQAGNGRQGVVQWMDPQSVSLYAQGVGFRSFVTV